MAVSIEDRGRVRVVAIDRAHVRNAVNPATAQALFDAFRAFDADPSVDVAVLTGRGGHFCAGFDLKAAAGGEGAEWIRACDIPPDWTDPAARPLPGPMGPSRLMLSKPVIAAVEGYAVAGGMELAAWADVRVVSEAATFG
ncbi:MAG: enoyl-CoA hydratase, partial [Alphaproteobacteria bacterium]